MYELPTQVDICGVEYKIRNDGDYRMVLDAFSALNDFEIEKKERILTALLIFYDGMTSLEDVLALPDLDEATKQMFEFFNAGRPESTGPNRKLIDWDGDSAMIVSAINQVAGKEVRAESYMHWWTFMGYYSAIGESTLSTVVGIRDKIMKNKKLEKWERQFRIENPQYFNWDYKSADDKEADEWLKSVWNKE
jgi:hypothetical protein